MRISQLSTLAKTAVVSADFLLTANSTNSVNQKLAVADLFPNITNYGSTTGAVSLISAVSSKNVYTLSKIVAGSTKITVSGGGGSADVSVDLGTINFSDISGTVTNTQLYGNIDLTQKVTGTLPTSNGGTGSTATAYCSLTSNVSGTLPTSKGGTGIDSSSSAFTRYALFYASNTTVMGQLAAATDGQVLIGSSSAAPVWASLTSGDGSIAITNGAGTIGLSVTSIPDINSNVEFTAGSDRYVKPKSTTGAADRLYIQGGASTSGAGGDLYLEGGDTSHAGSNSGKVIISTGTGSSTIQDIQFIQNASSSTTATPLKIKDNKVCITNGTTDRDPDCSLHVWSKDGTGKPGLRIDQLDSDEPFIRLEPSGTGTSKGGNIDTECDGDTSGSTVAAPHSATWTLKGMFRINISGTDYWVPFYL
tara:strand:+ start:1030 stop:2289 length:1260 start_codon:yes stop_codon:yes gene_type:complete